MKYLSYLFINCRNFIEYTIGDIFPDCDETIKDYKIADVQFRTLTDNEGYFIFETFTALKAPIADWVSGRLDMYYMQWNTLHGEQYCYKEHKWLNDFDPNTLNRKIIMASLLNKQEK